MEYVYVVAGVLGVLGFALWSMRWLERTVRSEVTEEIGPAKFEEGFARGKAEAQQRHLEDAAIWARRLAAAHAAANLPAPPDVRGYLGSGSQVTVPEGYVMTVRKEPAKS